MRLLTYIDLGMTVSTQITIVLEIMAVKYWQKEVGLS